MEFQENQLANIHKLTLYLLLAFDKVCRDNRLTYFLDSGTALGAVRHNGFIPWDDDVDVGMPRKDYERFLKIGQPLLPEGIFIQTRDTDSSYKRFPAKLRLEGTHFPESQRSSCEHDGIFIDIFPFDSVPHKQFFAKFHVFISRCLFWVLRSWRSHSISPSRLLRCLAFLVDRLPQSSINSIRGLYLRICRKYEGINTGKITCFFWRMTQNKTYIFDSNKLFPTKDILFEGHLVRIVRDTDHYLSIMYGDYMTLPPENQREYHCRGEIDFGDYA